MSVHLENVEGEAAEPREDGGVDTDARAILAHGDVTLAVFAAFSVAFLIEPLRWNFLAAGAFLVAAAVFIFLPAE